MSFKGFAIILTVCLLLFVLTAGKQNPADTLLLNSGGLRFSSKDVFSSQRTSLSLFDDYKHVPKSFDLKFTCNIYNFKLYGYVLRVMNNFGDYQAPLIHLLYIPPQNNSNSCAFEFHFNNSEYKITFMLDTLHLNDISFQISANVKDKLISIKCNETEEKINFELPRDMYLNFLFGLYGENTDVAPMIVQNIRLSLSNQTQYYWPLNEFTGNIAHDYLSQVRSKVQNPTWLQDKHYYWEKIFVQKTDPMVGIVFDDYNRILLLNKDSMIIFDPRNLVTKSQKYKDPRPFDRNAFFAVFNPKTRKIIGYDFHFLKVNDGRKTYSVYDFEENTWTKVDTSAAVDQNHHHSVFWNRDTTKLVTFGGYSYFHYYNSFKLFDFTDGFWENTEFSGDTIYPRTHTAVGRSRYNGQYYLYGGFGNKEGSQPLEGRYFYDLYNINPDTKTITRIWNISSPRYEFVPRGNLIFRANADVFYVLGNKPIEKSYLKLYEISFKKPIINIVSDSIPVVFSDMAGNAFLFHNLAAGELYCVTRETSNNPYAITTVYRLSFPPSGMPENIVVNKIMAKLKYLLFIIPLIALGILMYFLKFHRHRIKFLPERVAAVEKFERKKQNAVWLLDEFRVYDKNGRDITYRFAKKIRHAFLILFFENYLHDGILSSDFSDLLWPGLTRDQQKNNRGVLLNNLRKIFEDLNDIHLSKDNSNWKLFYGPDLYVDFIEVRKLLLSERKEEENETLLSFFSLGNLLKGENWDYLDPYKENYSNTAIDILVESCKTSFVEKNYMKSIEMADILLGHFDFLNEPALFYKIKALYILKNSIKAVSEYNKFRMKYNDSLSKSFPLTLEDILNMPVPIELAD